ncbi:stage III sporulation protein AE [Thermoactinomyces daqus]|jgi:stage III sporulation protein AE|uniref:Stage III sporulation protein AE n=1 Tax=Thermoactinomyces daqus TaxID=1329516 RepID=A0A7W1XD95_9BACL|nr:MULTISPECIES: stage III sporulation protein AE [Thermoactinomyces]MBA4544532.1 stage III sporulation protein AE [Thermoactinomyces daqus]MBH8603514.1 stage III sporulation protein AE [Thermoactinomyces sp. CICC 10522]
MRWKRRFFWMLPVILALWFTPLIAGAQEGGEGQDASITNQLVRSQLNQLQTKQVESFWSQLSDDYGQFFDRGNFPNLFDMLLSGKKEWSIKDVALAFLRYFFHEILYNGKLLGSILILTVFSMILQTLQTAFERNQVSKVAYAIAFLVLIILMVNSFHVAVEAARTAIGRMIDFMLALVPLMLTLMMTMGNIGSATLFHPFIVFMIHTIGTFIYTLVFPLLFFSAILSIVSSLSDKYKVNQLAGLMRKISISLLGGLLTIFLGVLSIQGTASAVTDGITLRTAKYITGNFVPVIGRTISEAADTVVGASLLVKNTIGLAGVIILLMICAFPAVKILSLALIYNFSAAVMQPLGNSPIIESLETIGRTLIYIFAALATVGLMFFLAITIIVASGNIAAMVR